MTLSEKLNEDMKSAMKEKNLIKLETLRFLKASIGNFLIEKRKDKAEDPEIISLIQKQVKLRQDSIEGYQKGGRKELVEKETREKQILESYLPAGLSEKEVEVLVKQAIQTTGAKGKADMGKVMKEAMNLAKNRADGRLINQIAARLLP